MGNQNHMDMGGLDLIVRSLRLASTPNQSGTEVISSDGDVTLGDDLTIAGTLTATSDTRTGAGAISLTTLHTNVVTTGADALTLADGSAGQIKMITMITDGGDGTLTPTNLTPGSTITFNDAGDSVILIFTNSAWHILANQGCTLA